MNTDALKQVLAWVRTTDLAEVEYRHKETSFDFRREGSAAAPAPGWPGSALVPVPSPAVGVFRSSRPGRSRRIEEGTSVDDQEALGAVETGVQTAPVLAPAAGKVAKVLVQDGASVEYGQTLFLVCP